MKQGYEESLKGAFAAYKGLDDKFGVDIVILEMHKIIPITDYFVIATGSNINQMKAMAEACETEMYNAGFNLKHSEGQHSSTWILLDFGDVIVHILNEEDRQFYRLERIWGDAPRIEYQELRSEEKKSE